jgi:hypothetical protein
VKYILSICMIILTIDVTTVVVYRTWWIYHQWKVRRAYADARWEPVTTPKGDGTVTVEVSKIARWGKHDNQIAIMTGPEFVSTVDPLDVASQSMEAALEMAQIRCSTYNSLSHS